MIAGVAGSLSRGDCDKSFDYARRVADSEVSKEKRVWCKEDDDASTSE